MRAILVSLAVLVGLTAGTTSFAGHGHHGGWGGGHYHGGWGGGWGGGYRPHYAGYGWNHGYGGWNRGYYNHWNRGYYGGNFYRPYYTGYRGYGYGFGYRNFYYAPSFYRSYYYGGYPVLYNYPTYYPYSYGYPCYGVNDFGGAPNFVYGATSTPPSYATSELPYGFDGVRPFLDSLQVNNNSAPATIAAAILQNRLASRPQNSILNRFSGEQVAVAAPPVAAPATNFSPTVSPPLARQRARDMITVGDRYFREQKYYDASRKYREAAQTAPDLAEAHFRAGHALTALNRYDQAAESFRKAISLKADTARDGFKLDDLYGDAQIAKTSHIEALAAAAIEDVNRADHLLILGMLLHYDGQGDLAEKCFRRSSALDRNLKGLTAYVADNEI